MKSECEIPRQNATRVEVETILASTRVIAVVGLSDKPERASFQVAAYLQAHGYRIIPVNPNASAVLGEKSYPTLRDAPGPVDLVDIFRQPDAVPAIVEDAIAIGARTIWMQEGIVHNAAADQARAAGLRVVMNKCLLKEHRRSPPNPNAKVSTMNPLYIRETTGSVDAVGQRLEAAVKRHQFGVIGVVDLKAKMTEKGVAFGPACRIYEVCNPHRAKQVLEKNLAISTALPCRISIYEEAGRIKVATLLPSETLKMFDVPDLATVASEVETAIKAMVDEATTTDGEV